MKGAMKRSGNDLIEKIEALRRRELAVRSAIAAAQTLRQKREEREYRRLVGIVGTALLTYAAQASDFDLMIRGILKTAVTDERSRKFLADLGWM